MPFKDHYILFEFKVFGMAFQGSIKNFALRIIRLMTRFSIPSNVCNSRGNSGTFWISVRLLSELSFDEMSQHHVPATTAQTYNESIGDNLWVKKLKLASAAARIALTDFSLIIGIGRGSNKVHIETVRDFVHLIYQLSCFPTCACRSSKTNKEF